MELIVDLHIHSHYSRATSKDMDLANIYRWGKIKGISVIGTGDITHPAWFREVSEKLELADGGLYQLKKKYASPIDEKLPTTCKNRLLRFIPTVEISTIYSALNKVRKIHQIVVLPDLETAAKLNKKLSLIGNLNADGRPILGLDSRNLLQMVAVISDYALVIPAHIWTPWFGIFGSRSGFDSLQEAYGDDTPKITAIETGLSSDPQMNWNIPELQSRAITSHSDAHSPQKLGREATVINSELDYKNIFEALTTNDKRLVGTIEFYPQEGKYHFDGHRACRVRLSPEESARLRGICPVCGKPVTIGVENRVSQLSQPSKKDFAKKTEYIIPLVELIANTFQLKSSAAKKVQEQYSAMINQFGDEFSILRSVPLSSIRSQSFDTLATAIENTRLGNVHIIPGYDGVYGTVDALFEENKATDEQLGLGI